MTADEIFQTAQLMFLQNNGRKKVIEFLNEKGIHGEEAERLTTKAYLGVKEQINERQEAAEESEGGGMGWLVYVVILVVINGLSAIFDWPFWIY